MVDLSIRLPEGFLEEEVRCGYTVSAKMKELWAVELDLLAQLSRVCEAHGLAFFALGGTLLGAVRHRGIIPWDDDIDVGMLRADYETLCQIAAEAFHEPYFFQTEYTDPGSLRGHAQLRNSRTTAILATSRSHRAGYNQGIFIDIFPLDTVYSDPKKLEKQRKKALFYRDMASRMARNSATRYQKGIHKGPLAKLQDFVYPVSDLVISGLGLEQWFYRKFEAACASCPGGQGTMVAPLAFRFQEPRFYIQKTELEELQYVPFEFLRIPIAAGYEAMLTRQFGDYQKFEVGTTCHGAMQFDTEVPYTQYLWQEKA